MIRRTVPLLLIPLAIAAGILAATPWLHSFPSSLMLVPLFGAAVISPLIPVLVLGFGGRRLWHSLLADVVVFVGYALIVVLHEPTGASDLISGLVHGPSQILTFALPLVSPRSLLVAPVALTWLAGSLAGECLTRRWFTLLPFPGFLISYGLAYAATERAVNFSQSSSRGGELLIAVLLLGSLLLLRTAQAWIRQDETAESTQSDGILPLREVAIGTVITVAVCAVAALCVQAPAFRNAAKAPQRIPPVDNSQPLSPVAFVAGMRPDNPGSPGRPVFTVRTSRAVPGYFPLATMDYYDGAGWSFQRQFLPSGGVLPAETDPELPSSGPTVTEHFDILDGPLKNSPWMPYLSRPTKVTGTPINIDPNSGMIVPTDPLHSGERYSVTSLTPTTVFGKLGKQSFPATATATNNSLPPSLSSTLSELVAAYQRETGVSPNPPIAFLQAVMRDLQTKYSLSGGSPTAASSSGSARSSPATSSRTSPRTSPHPTHRASAHSSAHGGATSSVQHLVGPLLPARRSPHHSSSAPGHRASSQASRHSSTTPRPAASTSPVPASPNTTAAKPAGSTTFADVLASVVGTSRSGTPGQYATLVALLARQLGVTARVVAGFRVRGPGGSATLPAGSYTVTTADAWTWVEIPVTGVGWVVLDASPGRYSVPRPKPTQSGRPSPTPTSSSPPNALVTQSNGGNAVAKHSLVPGTSNTASHVLVISVLIAVAVLMIALLLLLALRKRVRRRRRQSVLDPRLRAIGAWRESIDVLTEAGLQDLAGMTTSEIVALAHTRFGPEPAQQAEQVGRTASVAGYSTGLLLASEQADAAWTSERELRREIGRQLGSRGRFAAWLRYHRAGRRTEPTGPRSWAQQAASRADAPGNRDRGRPGRRVVSSVRTFRRRGGHRH